MYPPISMNAPCPSEIWPVYAREQVEAEQGDEVDADVGELLRAKVADEARQQEDRGRREQESEHPGELAALHTRLVTGLPKSPAGRTSSTIRMIRSATGSLRSAPTKSTVGPDQVQADAEDQAPGDSARRRVDPAEHGRRKGVDQDRLHHVRVEEHRRSGEHPRDGAQHRGQTPADGEHPPHAHADEPARLGVERRGPQGEADFRELEERPEHRDEHRATTASVPTSCCEIETPPICHVSFGKGLGNDRISADQIRLARPLNVRTSPIVMITTVRTDVLATGAITTRCTAERRARRQRRASPRTPASTTSRGSRSASRRCRS